MRPASGIPPAHDAVQIHPAHGGGCGKCGREVWSMCALGVWNLKQCGRIWHSSRLRFFLTVFFCPEFNPRPASAPCQVMCASASCAHISTVYSGRPPTSLLQLPPLLLPPSSLRLAGLTWRRTAAASSPLAWLLTHHRCGGGWGAVRGEEGGSCGILTTRLAADASQVWGGLGGGLRCTDKGKEGRGGGQLRHHRCGGGLGGDPGGCRRPVAA